jgi:hypothetical protein
MEQCRLTAAQRIAAQAAFDDHCDIAPLLFGDAGNLLSVGARDRHRIADGEDLRMAWNGEIWQDQEPPGAVG